jgi:hypothetical protein
MSLLDFVTPDRLPHCFIYKGIRCLQSRKVFAALDQLEPATTIVELGTFNGGLTTILADHPISEQATITTFDLQPVAFDNPKITQYTGDIFSHESLIRDLIAQPGHTIVFCDGGNKVEEVRTFCRYLKPGDLICAHDYGYKAGHQLQFGWPVCEITYADVQTALEANGCEAFGTQFMSPAVWGCWRKK